MKQCSFALSWPVRMYPTEGMHAVDELNINEQTCRRLL